MMLTASAFFHVIPEHSRIPEPSWHPAGSQPVESHASLITPVCNCLSLHWMKVHFIFWVFLKLKFPRTAKVPDAKQAQPQGDPFAGQQFGFRLGI